jgi:hypothetical protein
MKLSKHLSEKYGVSFGRVIDTYEGEEVAVWWEATLEAQDPIRKLTLSVEADYVHECCIRLDRPNYSYLWRVPVHRAQVLVDRIMQRDETPERWAYRLMHGDWDSFTSWDEWVERCSAHVD